METELTGDRADQLAQELTQIAVSVLRIKEELEGRGETEIACLLQRADADLTIAEFKLNERNEE